MNFENAFENYKNGTATEEEKAYVEKEIEKARKLNNIIDEIDSKRAVNPAKVDDVKKVIKKIKNKSGIRTAIISFAVVIAVILVIAGSLFAYVNITASDKAKYSKGECIDAARQAVAAHTKDSSANMIVDDVEKELQIKYGRLSSAIYIYEIEVRSDYAEYDVVVDTTNGSAVITGIGD